MIIEHNHLTRDIKAWGKCPACDQTRMSMTSTIKILDHGHVSLISHMGGDLDIVNGARQSFDEYSEEMSDRDRGLINFLMKNRHTSPFELVQVKFGVMLPIFVAREWMRHRTQSFNEMSARYTQLPKTYYVPSRDDVREQKGKPGAYFYERMENDEKAARIREGIIAASEAAFTDYQELLDAGAAKEIARLVLPVNTYTKMVVSANLLNWMRFLSLRNHEHAQYEIRVYGEAIETLLSAVAPVAMEKFIEHGRLGHK